MFRKILAPIVLALLMFAAIPALNATASTSVTIQPYHPCAAPSSLKAAADNVGRTTVEHRSAKSKKASTYIRIGNGKIGRPTPEQSSMRLQKPKKDRKVQSTHARAKKSAAQPAGALRCW